MAASLIMGWTLAAPSAHAGTYTLTCSGGQTVAVGVGTTPPGTTVTTLYSANYDGNSNYGGSAGVSWYNQSASVTCSKVITATATWQPSDPNDTPPSSVIVKQVGTARYDGQGSGSATPPGKCNDGLGDAEVKTGTSAPQPGPPPTFHSVSTGTHWSVKTNPGASFALSTTPSASVSGTGTDGPPSVSGSGSASVSYAATIYPVTITPSGLTLVNGVKKVLTGQPITVSLDPLPAGCSASNYQWDISSTNGGSLCGGYIATQALGMTTSPSPLNSSSVTFYDGIQDTVVVNLTVTITFPDNTTAPATATAQVVVVKPSVASHTFDVIPSDNFAQNPNNTNSLLGAVESWSGVTISMPPGFTGGSGCFAQILNSTSRTDTRHTGVDYTVHEKLSNGQWIALFVPCLDTNFPYPYANQWTVGASGAAGQGSGGDSPYSPVSPSLISSDTGMMDWYKAVGDDKFQTWVMYNPDPQNNADIWVPLSNFDWNWHNMAMLNTSVAPFQWQSNGFLGDKGIDFAATGQWPVWNTWIPFTIINGNPTGTVAMRP